MFFLKKEAPIASEDDASKGLYNLLSEKGFNTSGDDIKWNFTKFLVSKEGKVIARFAPTYEPEKIADQIEKLINEK
ncbi:glutathione peroxidase-family protein [Clostridium beijerinckii]|nr:glutathione peroxidase-family protein [Clostridium beijerinckii]